MPDLYIPPTGSFCWIELGTTDQNAAKKFYGSLLGWTATDSPMGPGRCTPCLPLMVVTREHVTRYFRICELKACHRTGCCMCRLRALMTQ